MLRYRGQGTLVEFPSFFSGVERCPLGLLLLLSLNLSQTLMTFCYYFFHMTDNSSLLEGEAVLVRMTLTTCFRELHANLGQDSVYMTSIMSQGPTLSGWESLLTPYSSHKLARANGVSHFCLSPGLVSMVIAIFHLPFLCLKTLRNRTTCALQNNTRPRA